MKRDQPWASVRLALHSSSLTSLEGLATGFIAAPLACRRCRPLLIPRGGVTVCFFFGSVLGGNPTLTK